ncbi:MAG: response regulator [Bacillota bacterium]
MDDGLKALICDDSLLVRKQLRDILTDCGCIVVEAADGKAAVDAFAQHRPDVVFMDIVMPVYDGLEALRRIKETDPSARVVMVSSAGTKNNLIQAIEMGAADFLQKPYDRNQIFQVINRFKTGGGL